MNAKLLKNKWFLATVITAIVAIVAIVFAVSLGAKLNTPETPEVERIFGVGEEGVYYYDLVDGKITVTLRDGSFTMSGNVNKTGVYSVDGSVINLDFFKDEDGTTTATLDGNNLALVYENATISLIKEINYTVTFDVDGGSEVPSVTVINGKYVDKPDEDPSKDNHVFLGWYADAELKTPFSFTENAVKSDITVYARWAEKVVGIPDYTISFDLGYDGAPAIDPITTVSGVAYGVPTPEREGYIFGGWWISMYEDANKLSYAYNETKVFNADTTLFALWHKNEASKLTPPAVSITNSLISWQSVDKATSYKLTVIDPEGNTIINNENVAGTMKAFEFGGNIPGEYKVSVIAVAQNAANNSDPAVRYFANRTLDRVSDFRVENGILIFGEVENAQKYTLTIECGDSSHDHTNFDNGLSTTYYLANCKMQKGGIRVTVTASGSGYASSTSNTFVYEKNLDKIETVVYDSAKDVFAWDPVPGALSYIVTVTSNGKTYTYDNEMRTTFSAGGFTGNITVSVVPATNGYNSPEATVATCAKTAPIVPGALSATGDKIVWDAVEGATSYEVNISGQSITVTTNEISLSEITGLTQGQNYSVKVMAVNAAGETSAFSSELKVGYFVMENTLKYSKNTISWNPVLGVNQYLVRVNGGEPMEINNATSAKITLPKSGENIIEVCFVNGEYFSDWVSLSVTAYTVEYDSRTTTNGIVKIEYLAPGDLLTLPTPENEYAGYDFAAWYNVPMGVAGNGKKFEEGAVFSGNAYTVVYGDWTPKTYEVTLNTNGMQITNIQNGKKEPVSYNTAFVLTIPEMKDAGMYFFAGWYTGPSGTGIKITDERGASVNPYSFTSEIALYPFFTTNAIEFILQADDTYAVTSGSAFSSIVNLTIPVTYKELPVTTILESAFRGSNLKTVEIPDTVKLIGTNAFGDCSALEEINMYVAYPENAGKYETVYSSKDGVLFREDIGSTYLEVFPSGRTGEYTIPDFVDLVLAKSFKYAKINTIIIPDSITSLPVDAFYYCKQLKNVIFAPGRTNDIEFNAEAFKECTAIETLTLPKNIPLAKSALITFLNSFKALNTLTIEDGGENFATVDRLLTNTEKDTIYYAPKGYTGVMGAFTVPNGIVAIDADAFKSCGNITSVTIPVWVTSIGNNAFSSCSSLKEITFNAGRTDNLSIGSNAFAYTISLKTVTFKGDASVTELDTGVVTIGSGAFRASNAEKSSVNTLNIEANVNIKSIGSNAFIYQSKLNEINIAKSASITTIGDYAFSGCSRLTKFHVPATVTSIGVGAFNNCIKLAELTFETEGATTLDIKNNAFANCLPLTEICLPDHLGTFNATAFEGCDLLKSIKVNATNASYMNDSHGVLYKKSADGVITELLYYPKGLAKEVNGIINNLPDTLTTIGGGAFSANKYIIEVVIPKSVTKIDTLAFSNCVNLKKMTFSTEGTSLTVGSSAFKECTGLTAEFILPSYTKSIGANAFEGCGFTTFVVPENVTSIGNAAFRNCKRLVSITFMGNGALTIGKSATAETSGAFANCTALESINLPDGTTVIGKYAFYNCTALASIELGNALTTIGDNAFGLCISLRTVEIPNTITEVGASAFAMTEATQGMLQSVVFKDGGTAELTIGATTFTYNPELKSVTFPARTTKLAGEVAPGTGSTKITPIFAMFTGCTGLEDINVGEGEGGAFSSVAGVLYDKAQKVLIYCPSENKGVDVDGVPTLLIPKTVELVLTGSVVNSNYITTVTFEEYDKSDANYGQQLLTIGNYVDSTSSRYTTESTHFLTYKYTLISIGGSMSTVRNINLPSHLSTIKAGAFSNQTVEPMTLTINPDADQLNLMKYAFIYSKFTEIHIPGTVKSYDSYIFRAAKFAEEITINFASNVTTIPEGLFYGCTALESYEIPGNITTIGAYAFYGCKGITELEIPETVKSVGKYGVYNTGITKLVLHPYFTSVDTYAFGNNYSMEEVVFEFDENGNSYFRSTGIGDQVLYGSSKLAKINLEELNPKKIGKQAFYNTAYKPDFTKLTNLQTIGDEAFRGSKLVHVDLSNTRLQNLSSTGNAFSYISTLEYFAFPKTITTVKAAIFDNCNALKTIVLTEDFTAANLILVLERVYSYNAIEFIIPEGNKTLVKDEFGIIYDTEKQIIYSASRCDVTGYVMPDTVMTIDKNAFRYCSGDKLVISENVKTIGEKAFYECLISNIYIPASVESMGDSVFSYSDVKTIEFGKDSKLTYTGTYSFANTAYLQSIVLPDGLALHQKSASSTSKPTYLFQNSSVKSVTFGAAVKEIPSSTFYGAKKIEEINFQEGLEKINYLFYQNPTDSTALNASLKSITIPASVKSLESGALAGFGALETVTFAQGSQLTSMVKNAFSYCKSLKNINGLPSTLKTLDTRVFYNCISLESIDLYNTAIKTINTDTFTNTTSLTSIKFPKEITTISSSAFVNTGAMDLVIPATVKTIGASAFAGSAIKTVTFPAESALSELGTLDTASEIFKDTPNLTTVTLSNDLITLGDNVFQNSAVTKVVVADPDRAASLRTIGNYAFYECPNLTEVSVLESIEYIGDYAFYKATNLTKATLGNKIEHLGGMAFGFCTSLAEAKFPATINSLGGNPYAGIEVSKIKFDAKNKFFTAVEQSGGIAIYDKDISVLYGAYGISGKFEFGTYVFAAKIGAFAGTDIGSVTIPKEFGTVVPYLFMDCAKLESVTIDDGITAIEERAFYNCTALKTTNIPKDAVSIGDYAYYNCKSLDNIVIPATTFTIGNYVFAECSSLKNVSFEQNGTETYAVIGTHMFYNCSSLDHVVLPTLIQMTEADAKANGQTNSYTKDGIPSYMFSGTGIVNAVIPGYIRYFYAEGVFANCKKLEYFDYPDPTRLAGFDYYKISPTWLEGCDKFIGVRATMFSTKEIGDTYGYLIRHLIFGNVKKLYLNTIKGCFPLNKSAYFYEAPADFELHILECTYEEIMTYLSPMSAGTKSWSMKIYDKDGNQLFSAKNNGGVAYVKDKNGNVIWGEEPAPETPAN